MGKLREQLELLVQRRLLAEWNAMATGAKGGENMAKIPAWLLLILNFLMSDLFEQLVEWAKNIVEDMQPSPNVDKDMLRGEAVAKLRAEAAIQGLKVTRWQAGQAVEAAYAELNPHKTRVVG